MTEVPAIMPVTMPVVEPMSALVLLLLQVPPVVASVNVVVPPASQTVAVPAMAAGAVFTVMVMVVVQPEPSE